jgi:hypothetical protein
MNEHDIAEQAYKNGYEKGYEKGKQDAVKHGRWIDGVCSNCKEEAISRSWDEPIYDYDWEENLRYSYTETHTEYQLTDYCPNCGAKMDGDGDG